MPPESYVQLGFAGVFAIALLMLVRVYMVGLIKQNGEMVTRVTVGNDKIATILENHLSGSARSLVLIEERLRRADELLEGRTAPFNKMQADISTIMLAMVNSSIIAPGTKATVEPMTSQGPPGPPGPQGEKGEKGESA